MWFDNCIYVHMLLCSMDIYISSINILNWIEKRFAILAWEGMGNCKKYLSDSLQTFTYNYVNGNEYNGWIKVSCRSDIWIGNDSRKWALHHNR